MSAFGSPEMEAAVMKQSEDALRELALTFRNVGIAKAQIAMMLRSVAYEIDPPSLLH